MAKGGSLVAHSVDIPEAVQAGETFDATLTIRLTDTNIEPDDKNRCSNDAYCDGANGYCIRPHAVSPVEGVVVSDAVCIGAPDTGATDMDVTFTLTAPDRFAVNEEYQYTLGFTTARGDYMGETIEVVPDAVWEDIVPRDPHIPIGEGITKSVVVGNRTQAGGNDPPESVTIEEAKYVTGGVRLKGNAVDPDGNITGYSWVLTSKSSSSYEGHVDPVQLAGGGDVIAPLNPDTLPGTMSVTLFAHDSSGAIAKDEAGIEGEPSDANGVVSPDQRDLIGMPSRQVPGGGAGPGSGIGGAIGAIDGKSLALVAAGGVGGVVLSRALSED